MIFFIIFVIIVFALIYRARSLEAQGEFLYAGMAWGTLALWWNILVGGPGVEGWEPSGILIIAYGVATLIGLKAVYEEWKQWHDESLKTIKILANALPIVMIIKVWGMSQYVS